MPAPIAASSDRQSAGAMDAQRRVDTVLAIRARSLDVLQWMSRVMGWADSEAETKGMTVNDKDSEAAVERWFARMANGAALCQLIDRITATNNGSIITTSSSSPSSSSLSAHLHRDAAPGSFQARDNVDRFIRAAQSMGVSSLVCFDTDDLVLRKNDKKVVNTLMELSRQSALRYNIAPTALVQYDMEWEQVNIEQQKDTNQASTATVISGQNKDSHEDEEEEETVMTATTPSRQYEAEEKESASSHPSSSSSNSSVNSSSGDALDQAISRLLSTRHFSIPIVRVAIKNKKRRRAGKAEYRVGSGPKFTVRLLHGHLIAKRDNDSAGWVDLEDAIQERMTHERLALITA